MDNPPFDPLYEGNLAFPTNRRQFFESFLLEYQVSAGRSQGGAAYKLSKLGSLPDDQLARVTAAVRSECLISVAEGFVCAQPNPGGPLLRLFPSDSPALQVFNGFNGFNSLAGVADALAREMNWDVAHSFRYVRGLFLYLVTLRVCIPK
jgi:hypothetical protein